MPDNEVQAAPEAAPQTPAAASGSELDTMLEAIRGQSAEPPKEGAEKDVQVGEDAPKKRVKADETPPAEDAPKPDGSEKPKTNEGDEDKEGEDDEGNPVLPTLDEELAKNPAIAKRWKEHLDGFNKVLGNLQAERAEFAQLMPKIERIAAYEDRIDPDAGATPETAGAAIAEIARVAAALHKVPVEQIYKAIGAPAPATPALQAPAPGQGVEPVVVTDQNWPDHFDSEVDYKFAKKVVAMTLAAQQGALGVDPASLQKLVQGHRENEKKLSRDKAWGEYIDREYPSTKAFFKSTYGFEVTQEMFEQAVTAHPNHSRSPQKAVSAEFADAILKASSKGNGKPPASLPVAPDTADHGAVPGVKDLEEITPAAILASARASGR